MVVGLIGHVTIFLYNILYYTIFLYKGNLSEINYFKILQKKSRKLMHRWVETQ